MTAPHDIRLLISDVDGTLVTHDKVLTPAVLAAVRDLSRAGIGLALTSARPPKGMRMLVEPLAIQLPLGGFNGGLLTEPDLSPIERHPIDAQAARRSAEFMLDQGLDLWVYDEDAWYVRDPNAPHVAREAWILKFDPVVVSRFDAAQLDGAFKIVGVSDDHDRVAHAESAAQATLGDGVSATRSEPHFLDVTHVRATKRYVVDAFARRLNIDKAQIATIGDMPNDVLMFRESGVSIAMGNASAEVQAQAGAVTDSNEDDGFAKAVRSILLRSSAA